MTRKKYLLIGYFGAIAQLAERLDRTQEVGGSNPPSSIDVESAIVSLRASTKAYWVS